MLTLPVPEMVYGTYAVAAGAPPGDPMELARAGVAAGVPAPLRDLVLGMLGSPLLTLDLRPAAKFPPLPVGLLEAFGTPTGRLAAIGAASHLVAVRAAYPPGWPPAHEWAARAVAGVLGSALDAPVVDVFTPQVLDPEALRRSLPDARGRIRLVDWMLLVHTKGPRGFWFNTKGLGRFGLPELRADDIPADLVEPCAELLNGLAWKLLHLWIEGLRAGQRVVDLPVTVTVGLSDVAAAHGRNPDTAHREVTVRLDHLSSEGLLTVLAPNPDAPDGLTDVCARLAA